MKKLIIVVLGLVVLTGHLQEALALIYLLGAWAAFIWVLKKIGVFSAPRRVSNAAKDSINDWYKRKRLEDIIRREIRRR